MFNYSACSNFLVQWLHDSSSYLNVIMNMAMTMAVVVMAMAIWKRRSWSVIVVAGVGVIVIVVVGNLLQVDPIFMWS